MVTCPQVPGRPRGPSAGRAPAALVARLRAAGCVFAEDEAALLVSAARGPHEDGRAPAEVLEGLVARRTGGEPLETVLGWVDVAGLRLSVGPGVFVPRRRTGLLVEVAAALARAAGPAPVVVEACCGIAPVAASVAHRTPGAEVHAADLDPVALGWAAVNLAGRGSVWCGDLLDPLPDALRGRVAVLAANAPYVPRAAIATMPPEAREHEPLLALEGGPDGVDVQRRLLAAAPDWVRPGGHVAVETSRAQADATRAACPAGWTTEVRRDEDVDGTVVVARRPPRGPA